MKKIALLSLFCFFMFACSESTNSVSENKTDGVVGVNQFERLMQSDHLLIDVRTPGEFSAGYIKGAKNINIQDANFAKQIDSFSTSDPVLVYCKKGGRSAKAYKVLKKKGFSIVYDLEGGFTAWTSANKPFEK